MNFYKFTASGTKEYEVSPLEPISTHVLQINLWTKCKIPLPEDTEK